MTMCTMRTATGAAIAGAMVAVALSGCTGSSRAVKQAPTEATGVATEATGEAGQPSLGAGVAGGSTGCGGGPIATSGGHSVGLASCAGQVGMTHPRPSMTVHKGSTITLRGLDPDYTSPASSAPRVVAVVATNGGTATLRAVSSGSSTITLATPFCLGAPRTDAIGDHFKQHCLSTALEN